MNKYMDSHNGFQIKTIRDTEEAIRISQSRYVKVLICNKATSRIFHKNLFGKPNIIIDGSVPDGVFYVNGKF